METLLVYCLIILILYKLLDQLIRLPLIAVNTNKNYNIVITGCDSGFGNIFTKRMDRAGFQIFAACLTENGQQKLDQETSKNVKTFLMDVTSTKSIEAGVFFVRSLLKSGEGIHALINNAGVAGAQAPIDWLSRDHYDSVLNVNLHGVIECSRLFLPLLRLSDRGRIVNMASVLGRIALPATTPYTVSKFGVEAFSDCLRRELKSSNISVHIVEPGFFRTGIADPSVIKNGMNKIWENVSADVKEQYGKTFISDAMKSTHTVLDLVTSSDLNKVVSCYEHAVLAIYPRSRYMPGYDARFFLWPMSLLPEWMSDGIINSSLAYPRCNR